MLEALALSKSYQGKAAVTDLSLSVEAGSLYCLLGQNGAGKTTTINLFMGFISPDKGEVWVAGRKVGDDLAFIRAAVGYLPEQVNLYPLLTGLENLDFFSRLAGFKYSQQELGSMLERVGLPAAAFRQKVGTYSKGMRQKVGIAIALAKNAQVLLLDEPTSGLDPKAANELSAVLMQLRGQGMAILMATHDLFRARETATTVGIMKEGRLVASYPGSQLTASELETVYLETV